MANTKNILPSRSAQLAKTGYEKFMSIPNTMYLTVGIDLRKLSGATSFWIAFNFWLGFINLNVIIVAEFVFFYKTFGQFANFLEATAIAPCLGFCLMSDFKVAAILGNKDILEGIQKTLKMMFPRSERESHLSKVDEYRRRMSFIVICFITIYMVLIWLFNLSAIGQSIVENLFFGETFVMRLPYFTWYPFQIATMPVYLMIYFHQIFAGYTAVTLTISADILMCCIVTQLAMHFDRISDDLKQFSPSGSNRDIEFLMKTTGRHQILLRLCEQLNEIFSSSILFNFMASSFIICLVGFQATAGVTPLDFFKYLLFLIASLMQILLICYFGNMLIDSSVNVAKAGYEHNWIVANNKYKRILLFLLVRGQKPSALKVVTFNDVSLRSFNKVCSISYQFFALLRTVYSK